MFSTIVFFFLLYNYINNKFVIFIIVIPGLTIIIYL